MPQSNEILVLSINYEQPHVVETFVKYLDTSDRSCVNLQLYEYGKLASLKHYADLYILATSIDMRELQEATLERWSSIAGACSFGRFLHRCTAGVVSTHLFPDATK